MNGQWVEIWELNIKCQVLALLSVLIMFVDYFRSKRLPLRSTRAFGCFLCLSGFNLIIDIVSNALMANRKDIPSLFDRLIHSMYYISAELMSLTLFLYVFYLFGGQKRLTKKQAVLCVLPFALVALSSVFVDFDSDSDIYPDGPWMIILYATVVVYLIAIYTILFRNNEQKFGEMGNYMKKTKYSVAICVGIWIVFFNRFLLISSLGNSLMVLYVYLCLENPKRYADDETDTLNRSAFYIMVPEMLERKKDFWLVFFTIDDNKQISKSMGHDQMKIILRTAAERMRTVIPKSRFFHCRSNTLAVFISDTERLEALLKLIGGGGLEVEYGTGTYQPQYHISVLECPKYAATADEIYDTLDYVLNHYKKHGNAIVHYVDDEIIKKRNYRKKVLAVLTKAVQEKAFNVVYQPIFSTKDRRFSSAEALVRLQDCGELGFVSPEVFIPIAEKHGLISEIGSIVFEKVCGFAAENKLWEKGINYIEVNLSGMQCVDPSLPDQLSEIMNRYGIQPRFINLEITETASINGGEMLEENMKCLRGMGFHFSMDDFGTGYSNLSQIAAVHFELVKLDKSLIWPAFGENPNEPLVILNSCISMILQLGTHIVAEGVETKEQADFLTERGVNFLQGYYFSKPVDEATFLETISKEHVK